jgi:SAM-dependent methyltransferase
MKYREGSKALSQFMKQLRLVGSDVDNFGCFYCGSTDRERHLFMYFDKLMLWDRMKDGTILHFAPEKHLLTRIKAQQPLRYVKADISPQDGDTVPIDATAIPYEEETFDFLIANHILEHIPDYRTALTEFQRVLKPGGVAILQTPYTKVLKRNFEDEGIDTDELRLFFYGQEDHVRVFSERQFLRAVQEVGFTLRTEAHEACFDAGDAYYYGVPAQEDLILVEKQARPSKAT